MAVVFLSIGTLLMQGVLLALIVKATGTKMSIVYGLSRGLLATGAGVCIAASLGWIDLMPLVAVVFLLGSILIESVGLALLAKQIEQSVRELRLDRSLLEESKRHATEQHAEQVEKAFFKGQLEERARWTTQHPVFPTNEAALLTPDELLEHLHFGEVLHRLVNNLTRNTSMVCNLQVSNDPIIDLLTPKIRFSVYNALIELIQFAIKYDKATLLEVQLQTKDDQHLIITIRDNRLDTVTQSDTELTLLHYLRAQVGRSGGEFKLIRQPEQQGLWLYIWFPLPLLATSR